MFLGIFIAFVFQLFIESDKKIIIISAAFYLVMLVVQNYIPSTVVLYFMHGKFVFLSFVIYLLSAAVVTLK